MSSVAEKLAPEAIKKLIPYQSARRIGGAGRIWLNANELEQPIDYVAGQGQYHRYPDFMPSEVAKAYQRYSEIKSPVLAVRGADEAIDLLIRTFCQPGKDNIVVCTPTYAMYEFCAEALSVATLPVPLLGDEFELNVEGVISAAKVANVVFLCSPNNPTGNVLARKDIERILEATQDDTLVVVDEAYIEFDWQQSVADLVLDYPNLVVIRTLSKAFGLASVRCGFIIADDSVMNYVMKLIPPYPMPDSSSEIVLKALSEQGIAQMREATHQLIARRDWFAEQVTGFAWIETVYASATNFVLLRTKPGIKLFDYLLSHGIVTRDQGHELALANCVRITIGSQASMQEVLEAMNNYSVSNTNEHNEHNESKGIVK